MEMELIYKQIAEETGFSEKLIEALAPDVYDNEGPRGNEDIYGYTVEFNGFEDYIPEIQLCLLEESNIPFGKTCKLSEDVDYSNLVLAIADKMQISERIVMLLNPRLMSNQGEWYFPKDTEYSREQLSEIVELSNILQGPRIIG